jgi:hypothetical protein
MRQGSRLGARTIVAAFALTLVAFLGSGAPAALADTLPTVSAESASEVGVTTAKLTGKVNPNGEAGTGNTTWRLQYSPAGDEAWVNANEGTIEAPASEEANEVEVEAIFGFSGELQPGAEYEFRLQAENGAGLAETAGPFPTFTMNAATAPTVVTVPASAVTISKAHVAAEVDPEGGNVNPIGGPLPIAWTFEYTKASEPGAWQSGGSGSIEGSEAEGTTPVEVGADLTGLSSGTEYLYRAALAYAGGGLQVTSSNGSFTTTASAGPSAVTGPATHIGATHAFLTGTVNPNEEPTLYWFEYGPAPCDSSTCTAVPAAKDANAGEGTEALLRSKAIGGLEPSTTYHFRLVAGNASGTAQGLDQTFTTAAAAAGTCPNAAIREELHATELGNCRAWELASPNISIDVIADTGRTVVAATDSPGLPMAAKFSSLGGSADSLGSGIGFDYLAQRDGAPGTSGWNVHAITPPQDPLSFFASAGQGAEPNYQLVTPDLSRGIFRSFSSLPGTSANAKEVPNLYLRDDLRTPGFGSYELLSDSVSLLPPLTPSPGAEILQKRPSLAGASADFRHVLFETKLNLTSDASGENVKLYKSDDGQVSLVRASGACAGLGSPAGKAPCSMAGVGATATPGGGARFTPRVVSSDGSRVNLTSPFGITLGTIPSTRLGVVSKLYQLDDRGTPATADDALIQLSMSEKEPPEPAQGAIYETASTDGSRVFFRSAEQLTQASGSGLYMWQRQDEDETQELSVDASGGAFTLTAHAQPSYGEGELSEGSSTVNMAGIGSPGSFTVGQAISAPGIPAGTTVTEVKRFNNSSEKKIVLSNAATENGTQELTASFQATSGPLPWNATAAQLQEAIEDLSLVGTGNVLVNGGPGAGAPFSIEFTGAFAGVNVMQLSSDPTDLTGGVSTATVTTTNDVRNLTLIGPGATGVLGASEDGQRLYFVIGDEIWFWQDADGIPGGSLLHVASLALGDTTFQVTGPPNIFWNSGRLPLSRVTPDGRSLLFEASDGAGLPPGYPHGSCNDTAIASNNGLCSEAYVYFAATSTPSEPDIVCASCNLAVPAAPGDTFLNARKGAGAALTANHLSRALTDDGNRVFFNTDEPLVPEDTNGAVDVYEYDVPTGEAHLISGGIEPAPSYLMDSSADGSDVLFATRAQLAGWDDDHAYDLYDARVNGGFPDPPARTAPCEGESCRSGGAPVTPGATAPGSASLAAPGNPKGGRKACPKGKRAVRKNGKTRCVKKHHNHKRTANTNRRAGR